MPVGGQKAGDKGASGAQVRRETQTITDQSESEGETTRATTVFPDGAIRAAPKKGDNTIYRGGGDGGGGATV